MSVQAHPTLIIPKTHGFVGEIVKRPDSANLKIIRAGVTISLARQLKDAICFIWLHFMSKWGGNLLNPTHDKESQTTCAAECKVTR